MKKKKEVDMRVETIKWILAKKCPIDMFNNSAKGILKQKKSSLIKVLQNKELQFYTLM